MSIKKLQKEIKRRSKLSEYEQFEIETADPMIFKVQRDMKIHRGSGNIFKDIGCKNPKKLLKKSKEFSNKHIGSKFSDWLKEEEMKISLCPHCYCMTHTIKGKCGKCKKGKIK